MNVTYLGIQGIVHGSSWLGGGREGGGSVSGGQAEGGNGKLEPGGPFMTCKYIVPKS